MTCDDTGAGCRPEPLADARFDGRVEVREGPHRAGDLADRDDVARAQHAIEIALQLRVPERELEAERHRLGVDAVGAPDHRRPAVFGGPDADRVHQPRDALDDEAAGLAHLERLGGVDDIGRGQAEVQPARRRTDMLGDGGRERDHVVLRGLLDLFDARDVEGRLGAKLARRIGRHEPRVGHRVGGRELDLEPGLVATLLAPDRAHLGVGVAGIMTSRDPGSGVRDLKDESG